MDCFSDWTSSVLSVQILFNLQIICMNYQMFSSIPLAFFLYYRIHSVILNVGNWRWEIQFSTRIWSQSIGAVWFWEETGETTSFSYLYWSVLAQMKFYFSQPMKPKGQSYIYRGGRLNPVTTLTPVLPMQPPEANKTTVWSHQQSRSPRGAIPIRSPI